MNQLDTAIEWHTRVRRILRGTDIDTHGTCAWQRLRAAVRESDAPPVPEDQLKVRIMQHVRMAAERAGIPDDISVIEQALDERRLRL